MKNFEFKSQICTTKEQSERLLKLGLKSETSDCTWFKRDNHAQWEWCTTPYTEWIEKILPIVNVYTLRDIIPAWSMHRLIEIMYKGDTHRFISLSIHHENMESFYDLVIEHIEKLIEIDHFNKDFLNK